MGALNSSVDPIPARAASPVEGGAWHAIAVERIIEQFGTDAVRGLSASQAADRLERHGSNSLRAIGRAQWYVILLRQFVNVLILVLLVAALGAFLIGETGDGLTILTIVLVNGAIGFSQEWRAERALEGLRQMLSPQCVVIRDGLESRIDAADLVPGDIVVLDVGDHVPADLRVFEQANLRVDESALTGESVTVSKDAAAVAAATDLASRRCMAWMGTSVAVGCGLGVVVATGMRTEFGRVASLTQTVVKDETPLQKKLTVLARQLGLLSILLSCLVAVSGWWLGKPVFEMFLVGVALAVAIVPEGLPAVVTIALALGVRAMVARRALLRRLQAAEALGAANVICTDKTGTLTQNEMTVTAIWLAAGSVEVTGVGYDPAGHFESNQSQLDPRQRGDLVAALETGRICNHAKLVCTDGDWRRVGSPTEAALIVAAHKACLDMDDASPVLLELPFDSTRKRMTVVTASAEGRMAHMKGAPEEVLQRCTRILDGDRERALTEVDLTRARAAYGDFAARGLRTLALARQRLPEDPSPASDVIEHELCLLGIVAIVDPPRPEVAAAIETAKCAGIRVIMITGDAAPTALAIAQQIGLQVEQAVTGAELDGADQATLRRWLGQGMVFARTTPEHKLRIVEALQGDGQIVAMTGDGVNDAPALKKADVGISMGVRGTDVAREASDMILMDDNFASIVSATEEGRRQYDNIQKFVRYLMSSNLGEVLAIFTNILLAAPLILKPVQILWMNLVTDSVIALSLGVEPAEKSVMHRPPRGLAEPVLDRDAVVWILCAGAYIGLASLFLFHLYLERSEDIDYARTGAFAGMIVFENITVFAFRSLREPLSATGWFSNPWVWAAWLTTISLQVSAVYFPPLQQALHTVPLTLDTWLVIAALALPLVIVPELYKQRRWSQAERAAAAP